MVKYQDDDLIIRKSLIEDALVLSKNLRSEDIIELNNMGIFKLDEALVKSFEVSNLECHTVIYKDKIVMMYGLRSGKDRNILWMLSSEDVKEFPLKFLKLAKRFINEFKNKHKLPMFNYIHECNKQSLKLVSFCGATFKDGFESNVTGEDFIEFTIGV